MKRTQPLTSRQCAVFLGKQLMGMDVPLHRLAHLTERCTGAIKFVSTFSERLVDLLNEEPENFVIASWEYVGKIRIPHVLSENPRLEFCKLANRFFPINYPAKVESTAIIGDNVQIGNGVYIGHNVIVEDGVTIGSNTVILHNTVIGRNCKIGSHCFIKSGTVIGQKGFGFVRDLNGVPETFPHYASVIIGDHVEIGALNTIASGALNDTVLEDYVKTDDHVHIGHGAYISRGVLIAACSEISGGVFVDQEVWIGPNCSIAHKLHIGKKSFVGIGTVVGRNVAEQSMILGNPGRIVRKIDEENQIT